MAMATYQHTPAGDVWTVDDAFRYLTRVTGKQDDLAIYEITEKLLAGKLSITAHHTVGGVLKGAGAVPATFWRDHLALHVIEGRAEVRPLRAVEQGEYRYTLSSRDVGLLWPSSHHAVPTRSSPAEIVAREIFPGGVPATTSTPEAVKLLGKELRRRKIKVPSSDTLKRALGRR